MATFTDVTLTYLTLTHVVMPDVGTCVRDAQTRDATHPGCKNIRVTRTLV